MASILIGTPLNGRATVQMIGLLKFHGPLGPFSVDMRSYSFCGWVSIGVHKSVSEALRIPFNECKYRAFEYIKNWGRL
ncbi:hypothetical protein M2125_001952 [Polynucleobacter sphagniphilus]|nr:hypothetical protein [Polynucleobacter sphagniphilus]